MQVVTTEERPATWEDVYQGSLEVLAAAFGVSRVYNQLPDSKHVEAAVAIALAGTKLD